jgi:hypothetical protein
MRQAREAQSRDRAWLQQLARPVRASFTDTSMMLSVDRGGKSRVGYFADGKVGCRTICLLKRWQRWHCLHESCGARRWMFLPEDV